MKQYVGTKLVKAEPAFMVNGKLVVVDDFSQTIPAPRDAEVKAGYKVVYPDGYESWSPRDVFERAYLPLDIYPSQKTEQLSLSQDMIDNFIKEWHTDTLGNKTTVVRAVLRNGFEIVEASSCVSPENYDEHVGQSVCEARIKDKVWELLGFLLQTAVNGVGDGPK